MLATRLKGHTEGASWARPTKGLLRSQLAPSFKRSELRVTDRVMWIRRKAERRARTRGVRWQHRLPLANHSLNQICYLRLDLRVSTRAGTARLRHPGLLASVQSSLPQPRREKAS